MATVHVEAFANGHWFLNDENTVVNDNLLGYVKSNPELALLDYGKVVVRRNHLSLDQVKIVSGGASGHDPAYAGYVGTGMLTAAIQGDVFQSPPSNLIFQALKELLRRNIHGVLLIVNNNLNDRLSFGLATERVKNIENVNIRMLVVSDEINTVIEKRGLVGTLLVQKIAGAMAEQRFFLDEIYSFCNSILDDISTISVSFSVAQSPNRKIASSARYLSPSEMEFGAGFHGEPGFLKLPLEPTAETVKIMLNQLLHKSNESNLSFVENPPIVLIVNNLGSCSKLEEQIFLQETITQLQHENLTIVKIYCGRFFTSLKMAGFTITIMRIKNPQILDYLNYPCSVSQWKEYSCGNLDPTLEVFLDTKFDKDELRPKQRRGPLVHHNVAEIIHTAINFVCDALISCERQLNIMDSESGDSDTGTNIKQAAIIISQQLSNKNLNCPYELLKEMSNLLQKNCFGLSGIMYAIMLESAARPFMELSELHSVDAYTWLESMKSVMHAIAKYSKATVGGRTMYDPIHASVNAYQEALESGQNGLEAFGAAVIIAEETARLTKQMHFPDPGAHCVGIVVRAIYEAIKLKLANMTE